ncbi:MAG: V-type ATP synthase subunit E [Chloroflexota bacterium]|nr:V-type ATP synthase subunit E [Chloroflexota bacterium]
MPLEHILRAMQAQADGEIERITRAAETEAAQLIAEAETQAQQIRARHRARIEPVLLTEAASLQNKAKLNSLRAAANAREQLLQDASAQSEARLAELRGSEEYEVIFRALAKEAVEALNGELTARVDPRDIDLARATFAKFGVWAEIETQPIPLGGLGLTEREGRVSVDNTLASRLERALTALRGPVASILAGKSEEKWKTTTAMPMPA